MNLFVLPANNFFYLIAGVATANACGRGEKERTTERGSDRARERQDEGTTGRGSDRTRERQGEGTRERERGARGAEFTIFVPRGTIWDHISDFRVRILDLWFHPAGSGQEYLFQTANMEPGVWKVV